MQLNNKIKLSFALVSIMSSINLSASSSDYIRVNYMQYDENDNRVSVKAPSIAISKNFGVNYTLNASIVSDTVSGATPIYINPDSSSGASAFARGLVTNVQNIKKTNVKFHEQRTAINTSLVKRLDNRDEFTSSFSYSNERDYTAVSIGGDYLHWLNKNKNTSFNIGTSIQSNNIIVQTPDSNSGASPKVNEKSSSVFALQGGISQILNKTSLAKVSVFYNLESGYLSNPYYNIVRNTNTIEAENRPDKRDAIGFNLVYIKAFGKYFTSKLKYKYYQDSWDIKSHTYNINNYYEISSKFIFGFDYRYYKQSSANFYNSSITYFTNQKYASHDDRLSKFNSSTIKTSLEYKYDKSISYNISLNRYIQSTNLKTKYITVGVKYKF